MQTLLRSGCASPCRAGDLQTLRQIGRNIEMPQRDASGNHQARELAMPPRRARPSEAAQLAWWACTSHLELRERHGFYTAELPCRTGSGETITPSFVLPIR